MPRRSKRLNPSLEEKDSEPTVSSNTVTDKSAPEPEPQSASKVTIASEHKEESIDSTPDPMNPDTSSMQPSETVETSTKAQNKEKENQDPDQEYESLALSRARREPKSTVSYKDDSSSSEPESDDDQGVYAGLSKVDQEALRKRMEGMQSSYQSSIIQQRHTKLQEVITLFSNIGAVVNQMEAGFIYDFCAKYQHDISQRIQDEGDFFLHSMRELMQEKQQQSALAQLEKRGKKRKRDDSESEFSVCSGSSEDDYSMDSEWSNPLLNNDDMIPDSEEEELLNEGRAKRKRFRGKKRGKNVYIDEDGREYRCAGRLLLDDALKDTQNFEGWSAARVQAWKNKEINPNAYYYRFNDPGESQKNGRIGMDEHEAFMKRVKQHGVNVQWGTFSKEIAGRVGYQCSNYWRQMMKDRWVKDPNYWYRSDGSFAYKRAKKGSIPDAVRRFSFVVLKDPSGVFTIPGHHPKRPSDSVLKKHLQVNVKQLSAEEKKGGKKTKSKSRGAKKEESKEEKKEEEDDNVGVTTNSGKSNKKQKKKNKSNDNDDEREEGEEVKEEDGGKKKKSRNKKEKKDKKKKKKSKSKNKKKNKNKKGENSDEQDVDGDDNEEGKTKTDKKKNKKTKKKTKGKTKNKNKNKTKSKSKNKKKKGKTNNNKKTKEDKEGETDGVIKSEMDTDTNMQLEGVEDTHTIDNDNDHDNSDGDGKKRKRNEQGEISELEPPQKKRKLSNESEKETETDKENDDPMNVLYNMVDMMTGQKIKVPAISEFGHVLEYSSWCAILRNPKTKDKCPFTQKRVTRRSLVKLTKENIQQYKDKIINLSDKEMKKVKGNRNAGSA